ncbi:MAG: Arm DNA-binding domain-containing protein [Steroidobacteraceae bacterium]
MLSLGAYPDVSLRQARTRRYEARRLVATVSPSCSPSRIASLAFRCRRSVANPATSALPIRLRGNC